MRLNYLDKTVFKEKVKPFAKSAVLIAGLAMGCHGAKAKNMEMKKICPWTKCLLSVQIIEA